MHVEKQTIREEGEKPIYNTDAEKAGSTGNISITGFRRVKRTLISAGQG